jgi:hypothetical protein
LNAKKLTVTIDQEVYNGLYNIGSISSAEMQDIARAISIQLDL